MATPRRTDLPVDMPVRIGEVLAGKYRVEQVLGRGGMGLVVAARHVELGERVAVKLASPRIAARSDAAARALREARAAARIRSEHVARVFDTGILPGGAPYLVLEYLRGRDLRAELEQSGPLPIDLAVGYIVQTCEGLAEAHALGIVHRDIKPANLFLTRRMDGSPVVKIIDFGVSKILSEAPESTEDRPLTASGAALGTPHYMAPEQMRAARDVGVGADVFSLGGTLYGLLTGAVPFPGDSMVAVYDRMLAGAPSLRIARPEVPVELDAVIARCLRIEANERYPDVGALAAALTPFAAPWAQPAAHRAARIWAARGSDRAAGEATSPDLDDSLDARDRSDVRSGTTAPQDTPLAADTTTEGDPAPVPDTAPPGSTQAGREPTWISEPAIPVPEAVRDRGARSSLDPGRTPPAPRRPRMPVILATAGLSLAIAVLFVRGLMSRAATSASDPEAPIATKAAVPMPSGAASSPPALAPTDTVAAHEEAPQARKHASGATNSSPDSSRSAAAPIRVTQPRAAPVASSSVTAPAAAPAKPWAPGPMDTPD